MPRALSSAFSVKEKWSKELKEVSELEVRNDVQMVKTGKTCSGKSPQHSVRQGRKEVGVESTKLDLKTQL